MSNELIPPWPHGVDTSLKTRNILVDALRKIRDGWKLNELEMQRIALWALLEAGIE